MKVSILIVNWNTCDLLDQCLRSIYASPPQFDFDVWVVDNASTDGSLEMLQRAYPNVKLIAIPENIGFARANNQGMRCAEGDAFLLLNSDTIVKPGALDRLLKILEERPKAGIVGCKLLNLDGSIQESWAAFPTFISEILGRNFRARNQVPGCKGLYQVDWVGGACMLVRAKAVETVGMLDETYFMYSEEVDWCYRMNKGGWATYYLENAEIVHLGGGSASRTSLNQLTRLYDSKLRFFQKHYGLLQTRCLRMGFILAQLLGIAMRWFVTLVRKERDNEQLNRIQIQWKLVRWLWTANLT